jgi:hypothetical protein
MRAALGRARVPVIPGDPPLAGIMELYLDHAAGLRSPETARHHRCQPIRPARHSRQSA